jgi:hypothetical protein
MLIAQSTIKPMHSCLSPHLLSTTSVHPCYKQCCSEGGSWYEDVLVLGVCNPQSTTCDVCSLRFQNLSVNSDNLPFSYVILFLYTLICHYVHETWSWHAYRFALSFLRKIGCDTRQSGKRASSCWALTCVMTGDLAMLTIRSNFIDETPI